MRSVYWLILAVAFTAHSLAAELPVEMTASGTGLSGSSDQFQGELAPMTGDFDVKIRVESLSLADPWSEAGLIARESAAANARFAAALCTPSISGCLFKARAADGQNVAMTGSFPVNFPQTWLRLRRAGNSFEAYAGFDGQNWAKVGGTDIPMSTTVLVGLGTASRNSTNSTKAVFDNYGTVGANERIAPMAEVEPPGQSSRFTSLVISEIMYHPADRTDGRRLEFIELLNTLATPEDLSGYRLTGDIDFTFPAGTSIPGGGFLVIARNPRDLESVYGIPGVLGPFENNLPNDSGLVRLRNAQGAILLEVPYGTRSPWPQTPDGQGPSLILTRPSLGEDDPRAWAASDIPGGTPGVINTRLAFSSTTVPEQTAPTGEIVFNEIMFHPISEEDEDQFVELYNPGQVAVDLSGWQVEDGIQYAFPAGIVLAPGSYLVVAKNASRILTNYSGLNEQSIRGNFAGRLAHSGERMALTRPSSSSSERVVVDEVTYGDGGQWGEWADGGGSSLEKIDAQADSRSPSNWADSDETAKAQWTTISVSGRLDLGNVSADQLQVLLQGAGECLIDDVHVLNASGTRMIANSTFENNALGWTAEGTEEQSSWEMGEGYNSSRSYRIRAVARGDNQVNRVRAPLTSALQANNAATITAKVRWLKGNPYILFRLRGNWLEAAARMNLPKNPGTPGAPNSRVVINAGPVVTDVRHSPVLPQADELVTVSARVSDPQGLRRVILRYRIDPATESTELTMVDDGTSGDQVAADGIYTGQIPGQNAGTLVAFEVVAQDTLDALTTFPPMDTGRRCLVRFGEEMPSGNFPVYRIWMTQATRDEWTSRHKLNNAPLDITFVLGNSRVIYGAQALYAGSPYIAPGYFSPLGGRCGYTVLFPSDDRFLGDTDLILDWPGGHGGERTALQEQMGYWLAEKMALPYCHRYTIRLHVNGVTDMERGSVFEAVNQPNGDFVEAWMPDDTDGDFYKIDRAFEFTDSGSVAADPQPRLQNYTTTGGAKKTARYRWTWMKRATEDVNNYTNIFGLVDALNSPAPEPYTSATEALVDIDEWMGIFAYEHIIINFDAWGHLIGKNMYAYKPQNGKWQLYPFDLDWLMLAAERFGYNASTAPLFNSEDPTIGRMYNHPPFRRAYFQAVKRAVDGPMQSAVCDPVMDAKYASLVANGITMCDGQSLTDPSAVKQWFAQRRAALIRDLGEAAATFAITSNNGTDFTTNATAVTLTGSAPLEGKNLVVNGVVRPAYWNTVSTWRIEVPLEPGVNHLLVTAFDSFGAPIAEDSINITTPNSSVRPVVLVNQTNGVIRLGWNTEPSVSYVVEYTDNITTPAWSELQTVPATSTATSIELSGPETPRRFYRIRSTLRPGAAE